MSKKVVVIALVVIVAAAALVALWLSRPHEAHGAGVTAVLVETFDVDAVPVRIWYVVDGDTVRLADGSYVRMVGYNAWEKDDPLGPDAKRYLEDLCRPGEIAYLDVDDYEPRDKYGRTLGYLWCKVGDAYVPVVKMFLLVRPELVKNEFYIPPDEHPYFRWLERYEIVIQGVDKIVVVNGTGRHVVSGNVVTLTGGIYDLYANDKLVRKLILLNGSRHLVISLRYR